MGMTVGGNHGTVAEINVVPLIDILLVLLVIFMIIPHSQTGFQAEAPLASADPPVAHPEELIVIEILANGSVSINRGPVEWAGLQSKLEGIFASRAQRSAFIRGDDIVEFSQVARVIDIMHAADITSVGLLTPEMQKGR